jgi:predicted methyltransferase
MQPTLPPILDQANDLVRRVLKPGDLAVDATVGNGHDTVFLAECVGPRGRVIGFDIQRSALEATARRLREMGLADRVELVQRGHEQIRGTLTALAPAARPRAVMFNLGYRPGGDHAVLTRPETTIPGVTDALDVVLPGGIVTIVVYPGHAGGQAEADAVLEWSLAVPTHLASAVCYRFLNSKTPSPFLVAITPREPTFQRS